MADDEIKEVRRVRHEISERYGHDVKRLGAHYRELQEQLKASGKCKFSGQEAVSASISPEEDLAGLATRFRDSCF